MRLLRLILTAATVLLVALSARGPFDVAQGKAFDRARAKQKPAHDYPVQPVPFTAVRLNDVFWAPRIETNRKVTIPAAFQKCEESGRINNFERAAQALRGEPHDMKAPPYPFDDTDLYKVIEGAAYVLNVQPDPKLDAYVDGMIAKIAAAQEPDGYIYTTRTIDPKNPHRWAGKERWIHERNDSATSSTTSATCSRRPPRTTRRPARRRCSTSRRRPPTCSSTPSGPASGRRGRDTRSPRWRW